VKVRVVEANERELNQLLLKLGNTARGSQILSSKGKVYLFEIDGIDTRGANILKQDAISVGADCAVPRRASSFEKGRWKVLLMATKRELSKLSEKLKEQPFGLKELPSLLRESLENYERDEFKIEYRGKELFLKRPVVMGILNATPDSFSDGGEHLGVDKALKRAEEMLSEGAQIIDIGGESTRPGAPRVEEEEEIKRVIPIIREIRKRLGDSFFISVDTYKARVAELALKEGADIVNDISGLSFDKRMAEVVADFSCPVVIMHIKGTPQTMQINPSYEDVIGEIYSYFEERMEFALKSGIEREKIILDPGIGFGKRVEDNLCILKRLSEFKSLGRPILVGASRKSFIGKLLGIEEPKERLAGSLAAAAKAALSGAKIIRAHDVKETEELLSLLWHIEEAKCLS